MQVLIFQGNPGKGVSDGVFRKQRYFQCPPESAVFVGIQRVHKSKLNVQDVAVRQEGAAANSIGMASSKNCSGLKIGDQVVWYSDERPEIGEVKWIGVLPDARQNEITVGVEFVSIRMSKVFDEFISRYNIFKLNGISTLINWTGQF